MNITTVAQQWEHGWELRLNGEVVTQVSTLDKAAQQIRDYLDTVNPETDHSDWAVTVSPAIGDLGDRVREARLATRRAQELQELAAKETVAVVQGLRSAGVSVTDTAAILGVSRGRVSQLVKKQAA
ncbi:DNA-directed RNA polymerase specialized sigma subunit [Leucobacter exalbidus]|uniref:DNA-directed RNA polymerase specialized sigma subunit n=1 Tax=Leucobacter exalbidus TaxID=662960 RepID=A0A940PZ14_9MICO|nr:antitoxin HicB [Leucobacter exalbidus]MBP1327636.1 DNA-directed RNA polymerase specialized sigma subunit [Leucobacter exalbidus]